MPGVPPCPRACHWTESRTDREGRSMVKRWTTVLLALVLTLILMPLAALAAPPGSPRLCRRPARPGQLPRAGVGGREWAAECDGGARGLRAGRPPECLQAPLERRERPNGRHRRCLRQPERGERPGGLSLHVRPA